MWYATVVPAFATIDDGAAPGGGSGRIRYDLRRPDAPTDRTPVVLLGGMTQTISSWGGQLRPLSATRVVVAYEARGQGETELSLHDVSFPQHARDFVALLDALDLRQPVDVCGFSFGGRTALAIAAAFPERVRRLVVTGVGLQRSVIGKLIVDGWVAVLQTGSLEGLARVSLPDIVGEAFLTEHADMVEPMVRAVVQRNSFEGVQALLTQTLDGDDPSQSPPQLVSRITCPALVVSGAQDRLAAPDQAAALASALGAKHHLVDNVGHTVPIEAAIAWRQLVLDFLDGGDG